MLVAGNEILNDARTRRYAVTYHDFKTGFSMFELASVWP